MAWATALVPISLLLVPLDVAGPLYGAVALGLGLWFLRIGVRGFRPDGDAKWARKFFLASLVYLPSLTLALALDVAIF